MSDLTLSANVGASPAWSVQPSAVSLGAAWPPTRGAILADLRHAADGRQSPLWNGRGSANSLTWPGLRGVGGLESGGDLLLLEAVLVFGWCEHVQGAGVVSCCARSRCSRGRARELDAGLPSLAVQQLDLASWPRTPRPWHCRTGRRRHRPTERGRHLCLLAEDPASELGALVVVNASTLSGCSAGQGHAEGVGDEQAGLAAVDRPSDDHP